MCRVWGVGMSKASDLFAKGFSTVDELRTPEGTGQLNRLQKLGLKYHEDLILRIPRDEITAMVELIREVAESVVADKTGLRVVGVGSYRRGKKESGDCDVLVSHTDGVSHVGLLEKLVEHLTASGFLRERLTDGRGKQEKSAEEEKTHTRTTQANGGKYMGICLLEPKGGSATSSMGLRPRHRHVDIFTCPDDQWAAALLTTTGSDMHNRSMRHWCAQMGLALSEKALAPAQREERGCYVDNKYTNNKLFVGKAIPVQTERDIYDVLGLVYKEPHERNGKVEHKKLVDWDSPFVGYWLECAVMLPEYKQRFASQGIDGAALAAMRAADLVEVGVESAHLDQLMRERDRAARGDLNSWYRRFRRVGGGGFT